MSRRGNLVLLHIIVLIFGFTGILGKLIETRSEVLVFWRMAIAAVTIAVFAYSTGKITRSLRTNALTYGAIGLLIAGHWITFFEAIKQSNVSVTLACLSAAALFTSILEPIIFKRKVKPYEVILGGATVVGLLLIFSFETRYKVGIALALLSAFMASLFTVFNGVMVKRDNPYRISLVEMIAGVIAISIWLALSGNMDVEMVRIPPMDWLWIAILGTVCTAFAFVGSVKVMEVLTPFTVSLSINLEPVYGILLAWFIFGESERMTTGFYLGTLIILGSLFVNAWLARIRKTE
jgi:drug/metabolite transporter (DMT)-like permease